MEPQRGTRIRRRRRGPRLLRRQAGHQPTGRSDECVCGCRVQRGRHRDERGGRRRRRRGDRGGDGLARGGCRACLCRGTESSRASSGGFGGIEGAARREASRRWSLLARASRPPEGRGLDLCVDAMLGCCAAAARCVALAAASVLCRRVEFFVRVVGGGGGGSGHAGRSLVQLSGPRLVPRIWEPTGARAVLLVRVWSRVCVLTGRDALTLVDGAILCVGGLPRA